MLELLGIVGTIVALLVLYSMPGAFLNEFEKSCHESIKKRGEEWEEKERLGKELRKFIFNQK